jgi:hypothetical protein
MAEEGARGFTANLVYKTINALDASVPLKHLNGCVLLTRREIAALKNTAVTKR